MRGLDGDFHSRLATRGSHIGTHVAVDLIEMSTQERFWLSRLFFQAQVLIHEAKQAFHSGIRELLGGKRLTVDRCLRHFAAVNVDRIVIHGLIVGFDGVCEAIVAGPL